MQLLQEEVQENVRRRCNNKKIKNKKIDVFTVCRDGFTAPRHKEGLLPYTQNRTLRVFQHTGNTSRGKTRISER